MGCGSCAKSSAKSSPKTGSRSAREVVEALSLYGSLEIGYWALTGSFQPQLPLLVVSAAYALLKNEKSTRKSQWVNADYFGLAMGAAGMVAVAALNYGSPNDLATGALVGAVAAWGGLYVAQMVIHYLEK